MSQKSKADVWAEAMIALIRTVSGDYQCNIYIPTLVDTADEVANAYEKRFLKPMQQETE